MKKRTLKTTVGMVAIMLSCFITCSCNKQEEVTTTTTVVTTTTTQSTTETSATTITTAETTKVTTTEPFVTTTPKEEKDKPEEIRVLSECKTYFSLAEEYAGKAYNISLACSEIEGVVIYPGAEFNWHVIVGNTNSAEGYVLANTYAGGEVVKNYGGGVCQVSTTIYGNVLDLELEVIERHAHGMPVNYAPAGRDASVDDILDGAGWNFIWKNTLECPIVIGTEVSAELVEGEATGVLTITFYDGSYLLKG